MRKSISLLLLTFILFSKIFSQATGDYRSAATGVWSVAGTWQRFDGASWVAAPAAPSSTDGVITIQNTHTVTANSAITADQVVIDAGGNLNVTTNTLTIANGADVNDLTINGALNFSGGSLAGTGNIEVSGTFVWTSGTLACPTTLSATATMTVNATGTVTLQSTLTNNGTINWNNLLFRFNNGTLTNNATFNITNTASDFSNSGGTNLITNSATGTITKSSAGTTTNNIPFANNGIFNLNAGTFANSQTFTNTGSIVFTATTVFQNSSTLNLNSGTSLSGTGSLNQTFLNLNVNLALNIISTITINLSGGAIAGSGSLTLNGAFNWTSGNLVCPTTLSATATMTVNATGTVTLQSTLTNNGTINWNNLLFRFNNGTLTNNATFNITNTASDFSNSGGTNLITNNNTGTVNKSSTGTTAVNIPFTNSGLVKGIGTLTFNTTFTNNGTIAPGLSPGILILNGTAPFSANSTLSIEIMDGAGAGTGHDQLQRDGNLTLNGTLTVVETGSVPGGDYILISLNPGTITGTFATTNLPAGYSVIYNTNNVVIRKGALATWYRDLDGDSYGDPNNSTQSATQPAGYVSNNTDCNDSNANIHPGATEVCNGTDDDCDGQIDEGVQTTFYRDMDGDGFGNPSVTQQACTAPTGYVANNTDCNDNNANIHPNATEVCNGVDDDCDGQIDEGVQTTFYRDFDGDGFGTPAETQQACSAPTGYVANNTDCNDNNANIYPGATEVCNGVDDDCDGQIDEGGVLNTFYQDLDGDGFGNPGVFQQACVAPPGYAANNTDCNDNNPGIHPGATEICNNIDDDCDGQIDEGAQPVTWYQDLDGDGFGNPAVTQTSCSQPSGYVLNNTDCNDNNANINPNATEVCNGSDDDCDGQIDEGVQSTFYRDLDGDGFGNPSVTQQACTAPAGYIANNTDCNDNNANVHPNATEVCNGVDDDCDGQIDEGVQSTFYRDLDSDGFGNPSVTQQACTAPAGYVANSTDCNDNDNTVYPGATEICDNKDNDCDGQIDEGAVPVPWYQDADGDGFGNAAITQTSCTQPAGYVNNSTDCNDNNANIHPNATEVCNGVDDDCDGQIDEGVQTTFYRDMDGDGFGNAAVTQQACTAPAGYVANNTDCNDNNANIHPNATEVCNGVDDDCDGQIDESVQSTFYRDLDGDGFGNAAVTQQACIAPVGYVTNNGDCNDNNAAINPGATEICNGVDDDCDGLTDEGLQTTFYRDLDGDGFGNTAVTQQACTAPAGYVTNSTDCNDNNAAIYPGALEVCGNSIDDDCDGQADEGCVGNDNDGDGFTVAQGDCNDNNAAIHPSAAELCDNGVDENCNGYIDENCLPNLPVLALRTYPVKEGDAGITTLHVEVKIDRPAPTQIQIDYATSDEDATSGLDYMAANGVLIIPQGSTSATVPVGIVGDRLRENNERLRLNFSNPINVVISGDPYSRIMIIDDDKGKQNIIVLKEKENSETESGINIPNIARRNQVWYIPQGNVSNNELLVYTIQGKLVFKAGNYKNNIALPNLSPGIYVYQFRYKNLKGIPHLKTGKLFVTE